MSRPETPQKNAEAQQIGDRATLPEAAAPRRLNLTKTLGLAIGGALIGAVLILPTLRGSKTADDAPKDENLQVRQTVAMQDRAPAEPPPPPEDKPETSTAPAKSAAAVMVSVQPEDDSVEQKMLDAARRAPVLVFKGSNASDAATPPAAPTQPGTPGQAPDPDRGLGRMLGNTTTIGRARATQLGDLNLLLTAGTIIPCNLDTAIDTTNPGFVKCHLERDILSASGTVVLLDRGTQILGEYNQGLRQGQERIFVVWNRAVTPQGVAVDLGSPAADDLGRAGFDGYVETYFWTRFGGAMLLSIVNDGVAYGRDQLRSGNGSSATGDNTTSAADTAAADALSNTINIPPVLRKNQGEMVSIFVARDLDFSGVYRLRTSMRRP